MKTMLEGEFEEEASEQLLERAEVQGLFVGDHTLEIDLFKAGAHDEMGGVLTELAPGEVAKTRVEAWKKDPSTLEPAQFLKDINTIGKGRFAQRLSNRIVAGCCPEYISKAIEYVRIRCS